MKIDDTQSLVQAPQGSHHGTKPVKSSRTIWKMLLVMCFSFRQSCDHQGVGSLWFLSKLKLSMTLWVWYCCRGSQWKRAMCCITEPLCHRGIIPKLCESGLVGTCHSCSVQAELLKPRAACMSDTELQFLFPHSVWMDAYLVLVAGK